MTTAKKRVIVLSVIKHLKVYKVMTKATQDKFEQVQIKSSKEDIKDAIIQFRAIADDNKIDFGSLLLEMVKTYQSAQNTVELTNDEESLVNEAVSTGIERSKLLKTGLLAESRKVIKQAENLSKLKEDFEAGNDNVTSTLRGSADLRIDRAVKAVFAHNDCQSDIGNQWFITATAIQKLTNCNMPAIKNYLSAHQTEVDAHHKKHELTEDNNRGRKGRSIFEEVVV